MTTAVRPMPVAPPRRRPAQQSEPSVLARRIMTAKYILQQYAATYNLSIPSPALTNPEETVSESLIGHITLAIRYGFLTEALRTHFQLPANLTPLARPFGLSGEIEQRWLRLVAAYQEADAHHMLPFLQDDRTVQAILALNAVAHEFNANIVIMPAHTTIALLNTTASYRNVSQWYAQAHLLFGTLLKWTHSTFARADELIGWLNPYMDRASDDEESITIAYHIMPILLALHTTDGSQRAQIIAFLQDKTHVDFFTHCCYYRDDCARLIEDLNDPARGLAWLVREAATYAQFKDVLQTPVLFGRESVMQKVRQPSGYPLQTHIDELEALRHTPP